jgi:hypothetical protein
MLPTLVPDRGDLVIEESPLVKTFSPAVTLFRDPVRRFHAVVALGTLLLSLVGCSVDHTYLPALKADPMASYEAPGLKLSDSWQYAYGARLGGGVPYQAEVTRVYAMQDQSHARQLIGEAVASAESEGWTMTQPLRDKPDTYVGTKELVPGTAQLFIGLGVGDPIHDPNGPRVLIINIIFSPAIE